MFRPVSRCVRGWGLGWRVYPARGYSARTGRAPRRHKNGEYAAVTRGRPAFQRHEAHAEGNDTTPMQERQKSAVCRREQLVRRRRAPTLRKPFFCRNKPRAGLFRHSHSGPRVVIPPPHRNAEKMQNGSLITSPNRAPAETQRSSFGGKKAVQRSERVLPLAAGRGIRRPLGRRRGIRRPLGRRPASHLSGLRRSRCPAKRTGRGMAPHPIFGQKPGPTFSYDWRKT